MKYQIGQGKSDQILAFTKQTARDLRAEYADEVLEDAKKILKGY